MESLVEQNLNKKFDSVVILASSNGFTLTASVSYHYAIRFSKYLKVIFIQPDQEKERYYTENTAFENVIILHLLKTYSPQQGKLLESSLLSLKICKPLIMIYNINFCYFLENYYPPLRILHVTKNFMADYNLSDAFLEPLIVRCLKNVDIVVTVHENIIERIYHKLNQEENLNAELIFEADQNYKQNFENLIILLKEGKTNQWNNTPKKINILYDENSMHVFTISNYLEMFKRYSHNEITYTPATGTATCKKDTLDNYDAVIIFYSIRICFPHYLSHDYKMALKNYHGHKILMIQDDYDNTEKTRKEIERLGIQTVYTVVPQEYINQIYPQTRFVNVNFFNIMTGYISEEMKNYPNRIPMNKRKYIIGYRGRNIGYWYGNLAREKLEIGIKMKNICIDRGLNVDIEWEEDKRIYAEQWLKWLSSCKATLGTESGSNIFDDKGKLKKLVKRILKKYPDISYKEVFEKYLKPYEGVIKMNQISPKMFEAISLKVALILYEGEYSGILKPNKHYIVLKKDFSNIEEVLEKLKDDEYLQELVDNAYTDIMSNYKLSYKWLIEYIDTCIESIYLPLPLQSSKSSIFHKFLKRVKNIK